MFASIMTTTRISVLAAAALFALFVSEGCSRKSREEFATGVRLGKASKLCEKPDESSCGECCSTYDATFMGSTVGGKCKCTSSTETYAKSGTNAQEANRKIVALTDPKLSMDLPAGYRVVKGLSIEPTNWAQARSEDGFGDRFVSVNATMKSVSVEPFDRFVAARIIVLRRNVNDPSLAQGKRGTTAAGATITYELTVEKQNARMLVTFLETPRYIHEIKAWSVASTFPSARAQLETIPALVHEAP